MCIQLLSSADRNPSEPSLCACLCWSFFFFPPPPGSENAGLHVYVCVYERYSANWPLIQREFLEMQFPPFLNMAVFMLGLLEYESVAPQCQGRPLPLSAPAPSLSPPLVLRPLRSPRLAHALEMRGWRGEGDQRQGRPTAYTGKRTLTNRINTPCGSLKSMRVCGCWCGCVGV